MKNFVRRIFGSVGSSKDKDKMKIEMSANNSDPVYDLARDIVGEIKLPGYYYLIEATSNSFTSGLFEIVGNKSTYSNDTVKIFKKYTERIRSSLTGKGVILIYVDDHLPTYKIYSHYNKELGSNKVFDLILLQEFGVEPDDERRESALHESIAQEKIKKALVYSCYENNTEEILDRVKTAKKSQLNKPYCSTTPLGFCAQNDNLLAFQAIVDAGASIDKKTVLKKTPLEYAFLNSPQIVEHIYRNHRPEFDAEVQKKGFSIAYQTRDENLLQLILESGSDINCASVDFPPLHSFADFGNVEGIRFLLQVGADINTLNKRKETALERAISRNKTEAISVLREHA